MRHGKRMIKSNEPNMPRASKAKARPSKGHRPSGIAPAHNKMAKKK